MPTAARVGGTARRHRTGQNLLTIDRHQPSLIVCRKLTIASSSASGRPSRPTRFVFMLAVDSGAGQHVLPRLGHWVANAAGRRGIVEMHDRLQAFEISVVPVGLHEVRRGPLIYIAQCRHPKNRSRTCAVPATIQNSPRSRPKFGAKGFFSTGRAGATLSCNLVLSS